MEKNISFNKIREDNLKKGNFNLPYSEYFNLHSILFNTFNEKVLNDGNEKKLVRKK